MLKYFENTIAENVISLKVNDLDGEQTRARVGTTKEAYELAYRLTAGKSTQEREEQCSRNLRIEI